MKQISCVCPACSKKVVAPATPSGEKIVRKWAETHINACIRNGYVAKTTKRI